MSVNFQEILNQRADTIEAPKILPPGQYNASVKGFTTGKSAQKQTPYVEVTFLVENQHDIAPEFQERADAALSKGPVELKHSYYLSDKATYILVDFLEKDLGIQRSGRTLGDMLTQSINCNCILILDVETAQKSGKEYIAVKRTAPAA